MSFGGVPETIAIPSGSVNSLVRITTLLDRAEPAVRRRFIELVDASTQIGTLEEIADLLEQGRVDQALAVTDGIADGLATQLEAAYTAAGISTASALSTATDKIFNFNAINDRSVATLQRERLRLVREFNAEQRRATQSILQEAFEQGLAPIEQARKLRESIGLTTKQTQAVTNYQQALQAGTKGSLAKAKSRALRSKRFDRSMDRAIAGEITLTSEQIAKMTEAYRKNYIKFRAQTIARTETAAAVGAGDLEMWNQAIESGDVAPQDVESTWSTARDERVRSSHRFMNNQKRDFGVPFTSGLGNQLRFPADPQGPAADTVQCRCVVGRTLKTKRSTRIADRPQLVLV